MIGRILIDILFIFSIFLLPWWLTFLLLIIPLFYFSFYFEIIIFGIFVDALFAVPTNFIFEFQFVLTLFTTVLFFLVYILKKRMRYYGR